MQEAQTTIRGGWFSLLKESLAGTERDLTGGTIGTAIFVLAVPLILEMIMEGVFALVDIYFVEKLGANAVAVVGITESMMAIIYAAAIGLSIGATATISRRIGEKEDEGAAQSAVQSIILGVLTAVLLGIFGFIFAGDFLRLLGAEESAIAEGTGFTRIMLGGNIVVMMLFIINAIFRSAGNAAISMRVLWVANIINIILCPLLIFGFAFVPALGLNGAAWATTIGRGTGVLYALWKLFRRDEKRRVNIARRHWRIEPATMRGILKISALAAVQMIISTASWLGLVRIVAQFGSQAVAGYTIGIRIILFALLPTVGLSNAASTLVGQNLGADQPQRAEQTVWRAAFLSAAFLTTIGIGFLLFSTPLTAFFTHDTKTAYFAARCLHIVAYGFFFYAFGMVLEQAFNGAGDTLTPTLLNIFIFWLFEIPLAYILANHFGFGAEGVFWAITMAFSLLAVVSAILFKRGGWKLKKI